MIVTDPAICGGAPNIKGVATVIVFGRWQVGDSLAELAEDYGLTFDDVEEALRYEANTQLKYLLLECAELRLLRK